MCLGEFQNRDEKQSLRSWMPSAKKDNLQLKIARYWPFYNDMVN